ncbi:thioredoxin family protein [Litorilituus sediminis]|uniref:Thioredoxin family protein n=1 Tax=Litorilituus sediminis TaxID=718192 RepID=A0A4P6P758_9GAMM|nr:thioredoxin family protein [Litorilituus sediminis]QBG36039.1 thioredoxin family protein [Litorilituus sediminis]
MRILIALVISYGLFSCSTFTQTHHNKISHSEFQFSPSETSMQAIDNKLAQAKLAQQKLLIVLGANWCHDSQGLIQRFSSNEMSSLLEKNYQTLFVDIGYYQKGYDVVSRFGMPIYYGTPTVMIIDPMSNKITNLTSMQKWLNADSIDLQGYLDYFAREAKVNMPANTENSEQMLAYEQEISAFSLHHAKRLKKAYEVLGPALQRFIEQQVAFTEQEEQLWSQARRLRYNIQNDIIALRKQASHAASNGKSVQLNFPEYEAFAWE